MTKSTVKLPDYGLVTEKPGLQTTGESVRMLATRYGFAADYADGRDVLEVGCAAGIGLGILSRRARRLIGGDLTLDFLRTAKRHYQNKIPLVQLDGHRLPFHSGTFDLVVFYEAIYYLDHAHLFVEQARRVLRPGGQLLICSVNSEWPGFNPSPMSTRYWTATELLHLLTDAGFQAQISGGFRDDRQSVGAFCFRIFRRLAVLLRLIPKTMAGKVLLKRLLWGVEELPNELHEEPTEKLQLVSLNGEFEATSFKIIYATGTLPDGSRSTLAS